VFVDEQILYQMFSSEKGFVRPDRNRFVLSQSRQDRKGRGGILRHVHTGMRPKIGSVIASGHLCPCGNLFDLASSFILTFIYLARCRIDDTSRR